MSLASTEATKHHTGWTNGCALYTVFTPFFQPWYSVFTPGSARRAGHPQPRGSGTSPITHGSDARHAASLESQYVTARENTSLELPRMPFGSGGCCLPQPRRKNTTRNEIGLHLSRLPAAASGRVLLGSTQRTYWETRKQKEKAAPAKRFRCSIPVGSEGSKRLRTPPASGIAARREWTACGFCRRQSAKVALYCDIHKETGSLLWIFNISIKNKKQLFIFYGFLKNNVKKETVPAAETSSNLQLLAPLDYSNLI